MKTMRQIIIMLALTGAVFTTEVTAAVNIENIPNGKTVVTKDDKGRDQYTRCENNWCTTSYHKIDVEQANSPGKKGSGGIPVVDNDSPQLIQDRNLNGQLVLMNTITPNDQGRLIQLRQVNTGCEFFGMVVNSDRPTTWFLEKVYPNLKMTDWAIEVTHKRCGDIVSKLKISLPLSKAHTYLDGGGQLRTGYAAGDKFGV